MSQDNPSSEEGVTLAMAKAWLRVESGSDEDALIAGLIAAAEAAAEAHAGRSFAAAMPAPVRQAVLQILAALYDHRGDATLPDSALALLAPYRNLKL